MRESEAKNYVRDRMAQLESGKILRRGPGRPRIHPEGYKPDRRKPGVDPEISAVRSTAGKKGQQTLQSRIQTEAYRKKKGRMQQEAFDGEVAAIKEEMKQYTYAPGLDQQDTQEFFEWCVEIIEDAIWQRKWIDTHGRKDIEDEDMERSREDQQYTSGYPELRIGDLLAYAKHVLSPERTGLKKLVIRAFEEFIEWAPSQQHADDEFKRAIPEAKNALPKLREGSIFTGPLTPENDPRFEPQPVPEEMQDRRKYTRGIDTTVMPAETFQQKQERLQRKAEEEILRQKQLEHQREMDLDRFRHLQSLPAGALEYLQQGNDIFGATPHRR